MEPVTHILTGTCLARCGLNRRAAYATFTMAVAAEFPDIDTLWGLRGPVAGFEHHRGITHTFLGLPFEAALIVAAVYGVHRWRLRRRRKTQPDPHHSPGPQDTEHVNKPLTVAPVRWGTLCGLALLALLSHLLLDYTNNYGLRPFYPFNSHWYAASIVFIFDPLLFIMLLAGLIAPWLFGLVSSEVGVRRKPFRGRSWASAALVGVLALWALRVVEHSRATQLALAQSLADPGQGLGSSAQNTAASAQSSSTGSSNPGSPGADAALAPAQPPVTYLSAQRALASPDPLSPFRWPVVIDFGPVYQLAEIDTHDQTVHPGETLQPKPARSPVVRAAEASGLGRFYMNWSPMPFITVTPADESVADPSSGTSGLTVVTFRDPRFMGEIPLLHRSGSTPLTASVVLDSANRVVSESMDDRAGR